MEIRVPPLAAVYFRPAGITEEEQEEAETEAAEAELLKV
jgi:hypothetical protein